MSTTIAVMRERWAAFIQFASTEKFGRGVSLFRIVAGATMLYQYLINYAQRHYLFGPNGVYPFDVFDESGMPSLYRYSSELWYFELLFHAGAVVALLWMLGFGTRILTPIHAALWISMHNRNPILWDGGDNLMQIAIIYAVGLNLSAHYSIDAVIRRRLRWKEWPHLRSAFAIFHNAALLLLVIQVCLVYGVAGLYKVQGQVWQNGTAMYYATRTSEFNTPGLNEMVYSNSCLLTLFSYSVVAFQIAFTFLVFMGGTWGRRVAVIGGVLFHSGIFVFMSLTTFAFFMVSADLMLLSDGEIAWLARQLRRPLDGVRWIAQRLRSRAPADDTVAA